VTAPTLALAWLFFAHLLADFVIQSDRVATDKFTTGRRAWRALAIHVAGVAICLVPVPLAFGPRGLAFLIVVVAAHAVIDRMKIVWTRRVEAHAIARARRSHEIASPEEGLGSAWTAAPAALFVADQLAHVGVIVLAWALWLASTPLTSAWTTVAAAVSGGWDQAVVARVVLWVVVLADLAIVNIRAGAMFVATLVHPREVVTGHPSGGEAAGGWTGERSEPSGQDDGSGGHVAVAGSGLGHRSEAGIVRAPARPSPVRIGAAIGILERLLIVTLVLSGALAGIGFVVAAKTLARFKQLEDRPFAEYYLLGTLASVSVGLVSALVAQVALA
jgi:hypothetical protein